MNTNCVACWRYQLKYIRINWCGCIGSSPPGGTTNERHHTTAELRKMAHCSKTQVCVRWSAVLANLMLNMTIFVMLHAVYSMLHVIVQRFMSPTVQCVTRQIVQGAVYDVLSCTRYGVWCAILYTVRCVMCHVVHGAVCKMLCRTRCSV